MRALSCWFVEPEVGFEPTTFRLRVAAHPSSGYWPVLFSLLTLVDPSMQCGSDLGRYGRWNDRGNDQPAQGEIEQSASTFRSQLKGVT